MNLKIIAALTAAALLAVVGSYQLAYHKAWDAGRQDLVTVQQKKAQTRIIKQQERQQKDDARAAAADEKGAAKTVTITQEVVKYIRTPGRNVCTFDEARVTLKKAAVDNANHIEGYDNE